MLRLLLGLALLRALWGSGCVLSAGFWVSLSFAFYGLVLYEMQRMVNSAAKANEGTNMRLRGLNFIHNYSGWAAATPAAGSSRRSCCLRQREPLAGSARQSADAGAICLCMTLAPPPPAAPCWDPVALPRCSKLASPCSGCLESVPGSLGHRAPPLDKHWHHRAAHDGWEPGG